MLSRVRRSRRFDSATMKSVFRPSRAETVHMHNLFTCFGSGKVRCRTVKVNVSLGYLAHFRETCHRGGSCARLSKEWIEDTTLWR